MFTGIINNLGRIADKTKISLIIKTDKDFLTGLKKGASVAMDGICLTVVTCNQNSFEVNVMLETVNRTNIQYLQSGNLVNLELPTTANSFLSGHIVQGHIDGIAKLRDIIHQGNSYLLKFSIPDSLSKYIVKKGSIAVNGTSLTVIKAAKNYFTVGIIPYTWAKTKFHTIKVGDSANVEVDILAKYVERLLREK